MSLSLRFLHRLLFAIAAVVFVFGIPSSFARAATGTIDPTNTGDHFAELLGAGLGTINFKTTNGTPVVVTDTALTGNAWGSAIGWINLNPTNAGVTNTCGGQLGGYAWGQNAGWINFAPTNGGVTINPTTGEFNGHAWSQNYGWIAFACPGAGCVRTNWTCSTTPPPSGGGGGGQQNPTAACSLVANPNAVTVGGQSTLSWTTNFNAITSATLTSAASGNVVFPNTANGSVTVTPAQTTVYTATFNGTGATGSAVCSTAVTVQPVVVPPNPTNPTQPTTPTIPTTPTTPAIPTTPTTPVVPTDPSLPGTPTPDGTVAPLAPSVDDEFGCTGATCTNDAPLLSLPTGAFARDAIKGIAIIALVAAAVANAPGLIFRLQNLLFAFLGFKKRRRNWGVVYDSVTKQPLDPAYVVLSDLNGNEVASSITDLDGRYGFLVPPGIYRINAGKTHYTFPSVMMAGRQRDELYDNLYFGGEIEIKRDGEVITHNVPMDPTETDWNEVAKREQQRFGFFKRADIWFHRIVSILFWIGFALAIFSVAIVPVFFNFITLGLYILLFILTITGFGGRKYGYVRDRAGNPLAFGIVRIFNAELHREVAHKVINANGRYYAIVPKGVYYITIEQKNRDGSYTKVMTSDTMNVRSGIIKSDFTIY